MIVFCGLTAAGLLLTVDTRCPNLMARVEGAFRTVRRVASDMLQKLWMLLYRYPTSVEEEGDSNPSEMV